MALVLSYTEKALMDVVGLDHILPLLHRRSTISACHGTTRMRFISLDVFVALINDDHHLVHVEIAFQDTLLEMIWLLGRLGPFFHWLFRYGNTGSLVMDRVWRTCGRRRWLTLGE